MHDLISKRSATERMIIAKTLLESILQDMPAAEPMTGLYVDGFNDGYEAGKEDAEPRKGKWIYDPEPYPMGGAYGHYECDQCGEWIRGSMTNYCPNCGARMEE